MILHKIIPPLLCGTAASVAAVLAISADVRPAMAQSASLQSAHVQSVNVHSASLHSTSLHSTNPHSEKRLSGASEGSAVLAFRLGTTATPPVSLGARRKPARFSDAPLARGSSQPVTSQRAAFGPYMGLQGGGISFNTYMTDSAPFSESDSRHFRADLRRFDLYLPPQLSTDTVALSPFVTFQHRAEAPNTLTSRALAASQSETSLQIGLRAETPDTGPLGLRPYGSFAMEFGRSEFLPQSSDGFTAPRVILGVELGDNAAATSGFELEYRQNGTSEADITLRGSLTFSF